MSPKSAPSDVRMLCYDVDTSYGHVSVSVYMCVTSRCSIEMDGQITMQLCKSSKEACMVVHEHCVVRKLK